MFVFISTTGMQNISRKIRKFHNSMFPFHCKPYLDKISKSNLKLKDTSCDIQLEEGHPRFKIVSFNPSPHPRFKIVSFNPSPHPRFKIVSFNPSPHQKCGIKRVFLKTQKVFNFDNFILFFYHFC